MISGDKTPSVMSKVVAPPTASKLPQMKDDGSKMLLQGLEGLTLEGLQLFKKRTIEDNRMDSIFRSKENLQEKFDNRAYLHPHGMTDFDYKSIPESRREGLEKFKHKTRHENYKYLGEHYDLDSMLGLFFKKLLNVKPQDPVHFAADYFTTDILVPGYDEMLEIEKRKISNYRVAKMKAAEKITTTVLHEWQKPPKEGPKVYERCFRKTKPCPDKGLGHDQLSKEAGEKPRDDNLNCLKKLNIGPLALDFDTRVILPPAPVVEEIKEPEEIKKPAKKFYCGCKDPGRREKLHPKIEAPSEEEEEEDDDNDSDSDDDLENSESVAAVSFNPRVFGHKGSLLKGSLLQPQTRKQEVEQVEQDPESPQVPEVEEEPKEMSKLA